jgi:hypothetical protein
MPDILSSQRIETNWYTSTLTAAVASTNTYEITVQANDVKLYGSGWGTFVNYFFSLVFRNKEHNYECKNYLNDSGIANTVLGFYIHYMNRKIRSQDLTSDFPWTLCISTTEVSQYITTEKKLKLF